MKRHLLTLLLLVVVSLLSAETMPADYYLSANQKADKELKTALYNIIKVGSRNSYGSGSWKIFYYSDRRPDNSVWDMYSDEIRYFGTIGQSVTGMNIEHSFAKSWWGGTQNDAYKDCYHLNPSDAAANGARGNLPLGNVTKVEKVVGTVTVGTNPEYGAFKVWEPIDEYKGDFARAYFYMATCYENLTWRLDNTGVGSYYAMQNDNYLEFLPWEQEVLLQWHRQDPVSQKEIDRMDAISNFQHNRNPFIDYPCLVEYIWGSHQGEAVDFSLLKNTADDDFLISGDLSGCICSYTSPVLLRPANGSSLNMGVANRHEQLSQSLAVAGALLTQDLQLSITGTDADCFFLPMTTIPATFANEGTTLSVNYRPATYGSHTATLHIQSAEVATDITLQGTCAYDFHALPATAVTPHSFTANWVDAETDSYTLSLYTKQLTGGGIVPVVDLPELSLKIIADNPYTSVSETDTKIYDEDGGLKLGSNSGNGVIFISGLDMADKATLTINAKAYNNDNANICIKADGNLISDQPLTTSPTDYTFSIPEGTKEIALVQQGSKKRVYIYSILLTQSGETLVNTPIEGYPKEVSGTSANIIVDVDLQTTPVYYTVAPQGMAASAEIEVHCDVQTDIAYPQLPADIYVEGRNVTFLGLSEPANVWVYDNLGRLVINTLVRNRQTLTLPSSGFYLLQFNRQVIRVLIP